MKEVKMKKIFSLTYEKNHKIINFLGIKIKFRKKETVLEQKLNLLSKQFTKQNKEIKKLNEKLTKQKEKYAKLNKRFKKCAVWQNNFYRTIPVDYPMLLSIDERELLIKYFKDSKNYLEFGPGGSTFAALLNSNCRITAIESDQDWIDYLRTYKFISDNENNRLNFIYVDIGKIKNIGKPLNDEKKENYPNYSTGIYNNIEAEDFDLALVDGRFRVACVLGIILNCKHDIKIMIHDYPEREYYHEIEEFLDVVETSDTLYVFKIKNDIDRNRVAEFYEKYKYQYE